LQIHQRPHHRATCRREDLHLAQDGSQLKRTVKPTPGLLAVGLALVIIGQLGDRNGNAGLGCLAWSLADLAEFV
jgi:hypothetical protein